MALFAVISWPPQDDKSLAAKWVNWAVDPTHELPILPPQLPLGLGDDPDAVNTRDQQVRDYDALYARGGWTRKRLELKVASDPFDPTTTRQMLVVLTVAAGLIVWRLESRRARNT